MKTTTAGFLRFDSDRTYKRIIEAYFNGEIGAEMLANKLNQLEKTLAKKQVDAGVAEIVAGDFSWYDAMLDMAFLLGAVPNDTTFLQLDFVDQYFALARGNQEYQINAWGLKKWFDTNYHYIVPKLSQKPSFSLHPDRLLASVSRTLTVCDNVRAKVIGPLTFLQLSETPANFDVAQALTQLLPLYVQLGTMLQAAGVKMQIDEPILCGDITAATKQHLQWFYSRLLAQTPVDVILQTYFSDVAAVYPLLKALPFYALGLDLVSNDENHAMILKNGWNDAQLLYAGVVDGRNVWKNNYRTTTTRLKQLPVAKKQLVISTSCPLLHVPYSLAKETLPSAIKARLAFAVEKLSELVHLAQIMEDTAPASTLLSRNAQAISLAKSTDDANIARQVAMIKRATITQLKRPTARNDRAKLQAKHLNLPPLPTTTIGSLPQTEAIKQLRRDKAAGLIDESTYRTKIEQTIKKWLKWQEDVGLDVLVHGEFERNDMVQYFAEKLAGMLTTQNGWVQSYGTRGVKPPIIWGQIKRMQPLSVAMSVYASKHTNKPLKGMLTGPITMVNWSFERNDVTKEQSAYELAVALQKEVDQLQANGIKIIQIDEAALREGLPLKQKDQAAYLQWAIKAFLATTNHVWAQTQIHTHMCYSEFGSILPAIKQLDVDVISLEAKRSHFEIVPKLAASKLLCDLGPGVYDIHSPKVPSQAEMKQNITQLLESLPATQIWINPDCGLKTRTTSQVKAAIKNMVQATKEIRTTLK